MVQTQEKNKDTHLGQILATQQRKSAEEAAAEWAAKASASKKKVDEWSGRVAALASLEQRMMDDSQQAIVHAAKPPSQVCRKIVRTFSVHNLQSIGEIPGLPGTRNYNQDKLQYHWLGAAENQVESVSNGRADRKILPKPKLQEEVQAVRSTVRQPLSENPGVTQGGPGKWKATADLDEDLPWWVLGCKYWSTLTWNTGQTKRQNLLSCLALSHITCYPSLVVACKHQAYGQLHLLAKDRCILAHPLWLKLIQWQSLSLEVKVPTFAVNPLTPCLLMIMGVSTRNVNPWNEIMLSSMRELCWIAR